MSAERIERPAVYPGAWMDTTDQARALIGCNTCGWEDEGSYEEVRAKWLAHTHDPVFDIEARLKCEPQLMPTTDVIWLLAHVQNEETRDLIETSTALLARLSAGECPFCPGTSHANYESTSEPRCPLEAALHAFDAYEDPS